jgi:DNA-directed RNA polymerase alpha subunit
MEGISEEEEIPELEAATEAVSYDEIVPLEEMESLTERLRERLQSHGIHTVQDLLSRDAKELSTIPGIGPITAQKLLDTASETLEENLAEAAESAVGEE